MTTKKKPYEKKENRPGIQGCNLARLRHAKKLSQRALAGLSGVHNVQIADLERGSTQEATRDTLERLAVALGVGVPDITEMKVEVAESPAVDVYMQSEYAKDDQPTPEEVALLKKNVPVVFFGLDENAQAISRLLHALRSASKKTH